MSYKDHAEMEFRALGYKPIDQEEGPNKWIQEDVMELLEVFSKQGHSGMSAPVCVMCFEKLALFEPLSPLTGEDWEWAEVGEGAFQNRRLSEVFKDKDRFDGQPYHIRAVVFWEWVEGTDEDGNPYQFKSYYTCADSFRPIEFPYTPTTEYVERSSGAES